MIARPAICLNMIVRDEAHIVHEVLDSVAPYISSWVIVDTGSTDGTQDLIRSHMAGLGISGELHERPWVNFGHNRTEALTLAQGHGDYIWVIDADELLVGAPDFSRLDADIFWLRYGDQACIFWLAQLFRDGVPARWVGSTHECVQWDAPRVEARLEGEYRIEYRQLSARNLSGHKCERDRDLLLADVERNPDDARSVIYLALSYFCLSDFVNARHWYARRVQMGGWEEEVYYAMYRLAESMANLNEPWPDVQDAYLRAWEYRPTRAEPLHAIAHRYRTEQRYRLGYHFAERAAEIPFPADDIIDVRGEIYAWRAIDEQAVCASWIDKQAETFKLCRHLLARSDIPEHDRQRIAGNRDLGVPAMLQAASSYPDTLVQSLCTNPGEPDIVVTLITGPDPTGTEYTLNSFMHCCTDISRVGRFVALDTGLSTDDRARLSKRYPLIDFIDPGPAEGHRAHLTYLRERVDARFWLHLGEGWTFFAPENLITRLAAVLEAEPQVFQVGVNFADAVSQTGSCAAEAKVRRAPEAGRYVLTDTVATGPAMFHTARLDHAGGLHGTDSITEPEPRAAIAGRHTATLDEVLCIITF